MARSREPVSLLGPRLLLLSLLVLSVLAAGLVWRAGRAGDEERLLRAVERANEDLQTRLDISVALLRGVTGLFEASVRVELWEFRAYVRALDVRENHPSLLGLGYAVRLGPDDVSAIEAEMHAAGEPEFRVWPPPTSDQDAAIRFLEPLDAENRRALGFTMTSDPTRRAAMFEARDTGEPVASDAVQLVQDEGVRGAGFLIFFPHYDRGASLATVEGRRAALRGYVYAPVRVREVFTHRDHVVRNLAIRAYDGPDPRTATLIHDEIGDDAGPVLRRELSIAGRTWTVLYADARPPEPLWRSPALGILAVGFGFAFLTYRIQSLQFLARLRAERDAAALRVGERRYRSLAEAVPQIVFRADPAGTLVYANERWPSALVGESLTRNLLVAVHPQEREETLAGWRDAFGAGVAWAATFRLWCPGLDCWRWSLARALPQPLERGPPEWVGTLTDIQGQKEAEESLQRETTELERRVEERTAELQRSVRELENFAAVASHDLQEPLRKIVSFGDRLADELGPDIPPTAADALQRMRRSAQRLQQLISDLLVFVRVSRTEVAALPTDLAGMAREVRDELVEGRADDAVVEVGEIPPVCGDPALLRQLLSNLVGNALKFHRPDVPPRVRVYAEPAGEEVPPERRDAWVRIVVEDEGIGFDTKYLHRIFKVFQRLHPRERYEGTGIGLAICQRVVELHGGRITARSTPSRGAAFVATLPRALSGTREGECTL